MTSFLPQNYTLAVAHEEMNSRRRNTMEDVHRILPQLHQKLPEMSYFAIYDGHGGRQIVDFLENALESRLAEEILLEDDADIRERITRSFLITDMESRKLNITTSGATAVVSLLIVKEVDGIKKKQIIVANVGDSRAVLASSIQPVDFDQDPDPMVPLPKHFAYRLSHDHRAEDSDEQKRISDAGGFVARNRVLGILAVSRSFGDHGMKDFVTAEPYISVTELSTMGECPMLILGCDGVWDVLTDQEAVELLMDKYEEANGPFEGAAELLVQTAIEKGSSDNVTAIVVFL